tara:strand:- start:621 stop:1073 length:453 start_codon:yes stop_codon:yes gene_type:complete
MSILNEIEEMGYSVRIDPKRNRLGVTPWPTCPPETRQWFTDHRNEIEAALRGISTTGTQLKKLIEKSLPQSLLDKVPKATCGCGNLERKMNSWGIEKCKQQSEYIISHLVSQSEKMGKVTTAIPLVLRRKAAEKMLNLAIRMEQKAKLTE